MTRTRRTHTRWWSAGGTLAAAALATVAITTPAGAGTAADEPAAAPISTRIVGGEYASTSEYPWVVYLTDSAGNQFCGGTIAAANKVITAAHCVTGGAPPEITVVSGRDDKNSDEGTETAVRDVWVHPDFQNASSGADVAVLTLDRDVTATPLPIATAGDLPEYRPGGATTVLGWGTTTEGGSPSSTLRQAHPPITSDQDCSRAYGGQYDPRGQVCAGLPEGGEDSCQGDSGGPLVAGDKLIGIVSWGNGCARPGQPGVYTRLGAYHDEVQAQLR
ncbi:MULTISPECIES: trypsin-like serine protease [unclassified Saccharopolyspora]|uniref:S1 family peptidase n=1 Tax=unclassified Saccharopolyspora TaxID=2646250 RepID=UPI001CD38189|nr:MULTISPECIES: serine protease [unclassified Saccharopolyspora]MCA1187468.1 serine protease [Saccharopolyspora sp. 6T]MCA1194697.1 serine protease [Saccharopolyspora sp. 6V]MCA1225856.1 serine protease [Saccharopolyspora sp. 6M]MCA1280614.1 serine protease [Saccharopolyspora sp. 7B]